MELYVVPGVIAMFAVFMIVLGGTALFTRGS
jgi:hypothetical protein